jgi:hypothetical protein
MPSPRASASASRTGGHDVGGRSPSWPRLLAASGVLWLSGRLLAVAERVRRKNIAAAHPAAHLGRVEPWYGGVRLSRHFRYTRWHSLALRKGAGS